MDAEEIVICCNCAYIDNVESYRLRCPFDREYPCPHCGSKALISYNSQSNSLLKERIASLIQNSDYDEDYDD